MLQPMYIHPYVLEPDTIFHELLQLCWLTVTEARQEYFMSAEPREYTYGKGEFARTYQSGAYSATVWTLQQGLNKLYDSDYNVCFLNRYNHQRQQLGWHADDSPAMVSSHPIAVVSFGAEREIWWRHKDQKGVVPKDQRQLLANGSLFIMPPHFQEEHQHRIPKADRVVGIRISLTFRRYEDPEHPAACSQGGKS